MSARRQLEQRRRTLAEIRNIMSSMRMLAFLETRKLARFLSDQQQLVASITEMAGDLLEHFPQLSVPAMPAPRGTVLIGTERGFCGDFNESLVRWLARRSNDLATNAVIAVGQRIVTRLDSESSWPAVVGLAGATATEDVPNVLDTLLQAITTLERDQGSIGLTVVYHGKENSNLQERRLLPPLSETPRPKRRFSHAPLLNLTAAEMFAELLDQYLVAALEEVLYTSLMAENERRVQRLDAATRHLDRRQNELARQSRALRQEEIIEEIEVLLLSIDTAGRP
jgi:F-type H+-transporting ATPase subunit gamma